MEPDNGLERKILSRESAQEKAEKYRDSGQPDPFPEIPPSLLAAEHIKKYVMRTGAIAPFHTGGGRHSRLKKASYEGRIGKCAYLYNKQGRLESLDFGEELTVVANSIVFVECNLDFRLPDNIALRFNLQIRHVHRGLLLGTGPLVDPGYWGKLCIPLHNLTDENYSIQVDDGLIWVEFTKTTAGQQSTSDGGRPPLDKRDGYWNIREFVERAARPMNGTGESVPIRSSISKVRVEAESAARSAKKAHRWASGIGIAAIAGVVIGLGAMFIGVFVFIQDAYQSVTPKIDDLQRRFSYVESVTTDMGSPNLPSAITELTKEVEELRKRTRELERIMTDRPTAVPGPK